MSAEHLSARKLILDSALLTYTASIVAYLAFFQWNSAYDQEFFERSFGYAAYCVAGALIVSSILVVVFHKLRTATIGEALFATPARKIELSTRPLTKSFWFWHSVVLFLSTFLVSLLVTEASLMELLDQDGAAGAMRLWQGMSDPNFALLPKAIFEAIETIFIAFLATALAIPIAFVLAFFCAKNLMKSPAGLAIYSLFRLFVNVSRSVEPLIWALIFTVWVGVGPFAGMLALMIHSIASLMKYYSEIIEDVDEGPLDGIRATGALEIQVVWYAVVPQVVLPYIAMTVYRWDTNVRMATVIGLVGGGGIGTLLIQYQGQAMWREVGCIILVIAVIVWLMDTASAYIREALK